MAGSKFCDIDNFEYVDVASIGVGIATCVPEPTLALFSIFMEGEAGTSAEPDTPEMTGAQASAMAGEKPSKSASPRTKASGARDIMQAFAPPVPAPPSFARSSNWQQ